MSKNFFNFPFTFAVFGSILKSGTPGTGVLFEYGGFIAKKVIKDIITKIKYFLGLILFLGIISSGGNSPQNLDYSVKDQAFSNDQSQNQLQNPSQSPDENIPEKSVELQPEIKPESQPQIEEKVEPVSQPQTQSEIEPQPAPPRQIQTTPQSTLSNDNYYTNVDGNVVHSPAYSTQPNTIPAGATARCRDGTYSFSQNRRGTCSHHEGVAEWL